MMRRLEEIQPQLETTIVFADVLHFMISTLFQVETDLALLREGSPSFCRQIGLRTLMQHFEISAHKDQSQHIIHCTNRTGLEHPFEFCTVQSRTSEDVRYEVTIVACDCDEKVSQKMMFPHLKRVIFMTTKQFALRKMRGMCDDMHMPRLCHIAGVACVYRHAVATFNVKGRCVFTLLFEKKRFSACNILPVPRNWLSSSIAVMALPSPYAFENVEKIIPAADIYTSDDYFDLHNSATSSTIENCPSVDLQGRAKEEFEQLDTVCTTPFKIPFNQ
ncbi:unnamed protein product [Cylicocyclus nassatus]|uniref:Uncharacterized protein n=1 Tax=Cylicocyclus nassatus TaxID=53992 RepID=A0AA36M6R9_CYLNA|nr:unnamed protein product [Cylicocyclus nassatus]